MQRGGKPMPYVDTEEVCLKKSFFNTNCVTKWRWGVRGWLEYSKQ